MDQPNVVLPKELRLAPPATMPQSRSYLFKQQAALSDYAEGSTIQINLPRLQRSYLTKDSYLEFEVKFSHVTTASQATDSFMALDTPGALGLISRIEVYDYLGSTQLESTSGFGQLAALLQDASVSSDEQGTQYELTSGTGGPAYVYDYERNPWNDGFTAAMNVPGGIQFTEVQPCIGEIVDIARWVNDDQAATTTDGASSTRTIRRRYHLPLFSFLGLLSPKYAPLHNGYTIMITLSTAAQACIVASERKTFTTNQLAGDTFVAPASNSTFTVSQARMCCQILELGPIAESMLISTTGGQPMIVNTKAYRNYTTSVAEKSSSFKLDLNINVASLTNVLWIMRPTNYQNKQSLPSLSHRQRNFLESWYFQYGSSVLPNTNGIQCFKPLTNGVNDKDWGSECLIEFLKARHMYNQPNQTHCFNKFNWAYDNYSRSGYLALARQGVSNAFGGYLVPEMFQYAYPGSLYEHGKFACGLDLELVSGRTNEIICGMNTNGMNTAIFGTFNATAAQKTVTHFTAATAISTAATTSPADNAVSGVFVEACTVDAWCEYDAFINVSPGIATTVSF